MQPVSLTYAHGWELRKGINYIKSMTEKPFGFNALIEKSNKKSSNFLSNFTKPDNFNCLAWFKFIFVSFKTILEL